MKKEGLRVALYARCSTHDKGQDPELQLSPLREYCQKRGFTVSGEYIDNGISGKQERRPELDRLIQAARKRQIDIILVWKLDRFGRSLKHLVTALDELTGLGIGFISHQDNIDLTMALKWTPLRLPASEYFRPDSTGRKMTYGLKNLNFFIACLIVSFELFFDKDGQT